MPQLNSIHVASIVSGTGAEGIKHTCRDAIDSELILFMALFLVDAPEKFNVEFGVESPSGYQSPRTQVTFDPTDLSYDAINLIAYLSNGNDVFLPKNWSYYVKPVPGALPEGCRIEFQCNYQEIQING